MNGSVEERLRRALAQQAETSTTSADAWDAIEGRLERRRPVFLRWTVLVPAAAAVLAVVVLAAALDRGDDGTVRVTGGTGRLHLVPTGVEPRFHLTEAGPGPDVGPRPPWTFRAFGRRAPDGVALAASVVVVVPADRALNGTAPAPAPLRVLGRDVAVATDDFGQRILTWTQGDGRTVGVMTFGLSEAELVDLAASLLGDDATHDTPALPSGFAVLGSGAMSGSAPVLTMQFWQADDGDGFSVLVSESPEATDGELAWWMPGGRAAEVRGTTGIYRLAREEALLAWRERSGTTVVLQGRGLTEAELVDIANGLRAVDDEAWRALVARGRQTGPPVAAAQPPEIGPPPGAVPSGNGYFQLLPVRRQLRPPCVATPPAIVLAESKDGREVACYEVTRPLVDAGDVATARAVPTTTAGEWEVRFTLTAEGASRLRALFDEVGPGGQFAVLVDGRIVSAPRFAGTPPGDTGVVTGLDEQTARTLADRLGR